MNETEAQRIAMERNEREREYQRRWRQANATRLREYQREYNQRNRDVILKQRRDAYALNPVNRMRSSERFAGWRAKNPARVLKRHRAQSTAIVEKSRARKVMCIERLGGKCMDCGITGHPVIFDFDHRDPFQKEHEISILMRRSSLERLLSEVDKCDLVCANCHRIRSFGSHAIRDKQRLGAQNGPRTKAEVERRRSLRKSFLGIELSSLPSSRVAA